MFFINPFERLRSEAIKLVDLPSTLTKLQIQGSLSELTSLLYSIYRHENQAILPGDPIEAYEKMNVFQEHLKAAVKIIIEDVHRNFETYKIVEPATRQTHAQKVLEQNSQKRVAFKDQEQQVSINGIQSTMNTRNQGLLSSFQSNTNRSQNQMSTRESASKNKSLNSDSLAKNHFTEISSLPTEADLYLKNEPPRMMFAQTPQVQKQTISQQILQPTIQNYQTLQEQYQASFGAPQKQNASPFSEIIKSSQADLSQGLLNGPVSQHHAIFQTTKGQDTHFNQSLDQQHSRSNSKTSIQGRKKTEYLNNLVYSTFQYSRGSASFQKGSRFPQERDHSPGPGEYMTLNGPDVVGTNIQKYDEACKKSLGSASFPKAKRDLNTSTTGIDTPGVGAYDPKFHLQVK